LPVTLTKRHEAWEVAPSTGGLVTALKSVRERREFTWLGWPGAHVPETERAAVTRELNRHGASPVFISKAHMEGFYENFSNEVLWPLFHNSAERSRFDLTGWKAYQVVNEMFADLIAKVSRPGDVVWIHDYQLALVPELLRRKGLNCAIGYFLHIPFPSAETYRTLPVSEAILRGMLGADLLAFHAYEYVAHFRTACLRVLGLESEPDTLGLSARTVQLAVLPIGIDPAEIREMAQGAAARAEMLSLRQAYGGMKIIVGVDRLDYTKGIPQKLEAFEELLRSHPKWRGKAVLIQVAAPSRTNVSQYQLLKREVDELVGRINGRFGTSSYTPVVYVNQAMPRDRLTGMYQAADIALVTPVRDGMNLVALEYVAARGELGGALILSEFAGAAHCLPGARLVNPYSTAQVADVLNDSLENPPSPEAFRHMLRFVNDNTSTRWANRFLDQLESLGGQVQMPALPLSFADEPLASAVRSAVRPLIFLDYDGTLRNYELDPQAAAPDAQILRVLRELSQLSTLYVISGRSAVTLENWLGKLAIGLVCEHGLAFKDPGGFWQQRVSVSGSALQRVVRPVFEDFVRRTPGSRIELKQAAIAWHYRGADPEYGSFQAKELLTRLEDNLKRRPFKVLRGSRVIEVRHEQVTKGNAVRHLLQRYPDADFLFCAGDDRTDEEMMDAIPDEWRDRAVTCWVGGRSAHAAYFRESSQTLLAELSKLARAWQKARGEARDPRRSEDDGEERDSARRNGLRGGDGKGHRTETSAATERTRGRHARTGKEKRVDGD
jgi:trehalose 6-phosphate synthase/phosphatase